MLEMATRSIASSPQKCADAVWAPAKLKPTPADMRQVHSLGYAPKPVKLEGRQLQIAKLVALGLADKEIAHFLAVSQGTVKGHVSMILRVLGLYRRTQICRYVYETGLFSLS